MSWLFISPILAFAVVGRRRSGQFARLHGTLLADASTSPARLLRQVGGERMGLRGVLRGVAFGRRRRRRAGPQREAAAFAEGAFDADLAAVFFEDLAAHRQAQAGAAAALAGDEDGEDRLDVVGGDALRRCPRR